MIKVALPNKGQLFEPTMDILAACGYRVRKSDRSLSTLDNENGIEFYFLRPGDIPIYVANGTLDAGITGHDFTLERKAGLTQIVNLEYGRSNLCVAVPNESEYQTHQQLCDKKIRIATSFPWLVQQQLNINPSNIVTLEGAVEISIKLGIADAIVDIVETGSTLKQAGLRVIGLPITQSSAGLYIHPGRESHEEIETLSKRLFGKTLAKKYLMIEYDVPEAILQQACKITPGHDSPTITALAKSGWFSVKAMVKKDFSQKAMDQLSKLGCSGILLMSIDNVRI